MQHAGAKATSANVLTKVFPAVPLLCLAVSGCGTTCVSGVFNGNTSSIGVSNISCPLTKATGAVTVHIGGAQALSADSAVFPPPMASPRALPNNLQHIFVTLRGIQANPDMVADEDSPAWQELAPDLSAHPLQVDLLALSAPLTPAGSLTMNDDSGSTLTAGAIAPTTVTADEYFQLRLRLLSRTPAPDAPVPETNACGNVGWNCIVFADHSARPLEFPSSALAAPTRSGQSGFDSAPEFHITVEHGSAVLFRVLPGEVLRLSIELDSASSVFFSSSAAVRSVLVFRVVSR